MLGTHCPVHLSSLGHLPAASAHLSFPQWCLRGGFPPGVLVQAPLLRMGRHARSSSADPTPTRRVPGAVLGGVGKGPELAAGPLHSVVLP